MATSVESGSMAKNPPLQYDLPVDSECKALKIKIFSLAGPHMRAFHLSWINFFMTFLATFAPAALLPLIRENLSLTKEEVGVAGVTAVVGAVVGRVCMGTILDTLGPRLGNAIVMLCFSPAVFLISMVVNGGGFITIRLFIGMSLCCFVCCQYWVGSMFNVRIVGTANAIAAGWGNMGGGVTQIVMPALATGIMSGGVHSFTAWRWAFFVPGGIFIIMGIISLLYAQDSPLGDFRDLKKTGVMATGKGNLVQTLKTAGGNYRTWILALTYGYSFGVELTVDNIIVSYLYDQFGLSLVTAGGLGAMFGLMNLFSRASGGMLSDLLALRWGMRGRLWTVFIIQMLSGGFCILMANLSDTLVGTIVVMVIFSIFYQQACGATFGVVPFVSRRSYGAVSGIVGAGGNVGSIVTQLIFFSGSDASPILTVPQGLQWMGVMTLCVTLLLCFVHFPMWGSMFFPANPDVTEEDYYIKEWTSDEIAQGLHTPSMKFAMESRSQRSGYTPLVKPQPVFPSADKAVAEAVYEPPASPRAGGGALPAVESRSERI